MVLWIQPEDERPLRPISRRVRAFQRLLFLLCLCALLCFQAGANAQDTVFNYISANNVVQGIDQFNFFGDATDFFGGNVGLFVVPQATPNAPKFGSIYFKQQVDLSKGFETILRLPITSNAGFSLVIKSPSESRFINAAGGDMGYNGFKKSIAIDFYNHFFGLNRQVRVYAPDNNGNLNLGVHELGEANLGPSIFDQRNIDVEYAIRYSPKSRILDIYFNNKLTLRIPNFSLDDYGTLTDGKALLGIHSTGFTAPGGSTVPSTLVLNWTTGNNLNSFGIGSGFYSDLFTFKTSTGQSIWGIGSDSTSWDYKLAKAYNFDHTFTSSSGGFGAKLGVLANSGSSPDGIGLRFHAEANGGKANITYPLYLNLLFPKQQSIPAGDTFNVASSFDPDFTASLTTASPSARFQSFLNFNTRSKVDIGLTFPSPFDFLNFDTTFFDINTNVNDKEFFDTDFILKHAALFGLPIDFAGGLMSLQDDEGIKGLKNSHRGNKGEGTSKGASKFNKAMSFFDLNLNIPNLSVNGGIPLTGPKTKLTGSAQDTVIGLHADFTTGLLALAGFDILANLINFDYSFDFGVDKQYAFGLHIADLFGDLNFGMKMDHSFAPKPHVKLDFFDLNGSPARDVHNNLIPSVQYDLNADGSPVDSQNIPMPNKPLVVVPTVFIYNPNFTPNNGQTAYNTFTTTPSLTIGGDVGLNAFQTYAKISGVIDIDTGPIGFKYNFPSFIKPLVDVPSFQIGGFQPVTGKSFTLLPADSPNPLITSVTPNRTFRTSSAGAITLTLSTLNASFNSGIIWDRNLATEQDLGPTFNVANDGTSVQINVPKSLLTTRGVHTLTLINGYTNFSANQRFPSNSVSFTVLEFAPTLAAISPSKIILKNPPINPSGQAILQNVTNGAGVVTEQFFFLTVDGGKFVNATTLNGTTMPGSVVNWNGKPLTTQFISDSRLVARVPATNIQEAGTASVTVTTGEPGGGTSEAKTFEALNPKPLAGTLSPATSFAGAKNLSVVVNGQDFVTTSKVLFNGQARDTTFVSPTRLYVQLTDADLAKAGTASIIARTDNMNSLPLTFTVGQSPARTVLKVTPSFTRENGNILMTLTIKNIGSTDAVDLALSTATLSRGTTTFGPSPNSITLPVSLNTLTVGGSAQVPGTFRFPADAGNTGQIVTLTVFGSFSGGPFTTKIRVTLP